MTATSILLVLALSLHQQDTQPAAIPVLRCAPVLATEPVAQRGDAADDPEFWLHPSDPGRSLLLGTNKKDGLEVYDLDGRRRLVLGPGLRPNNVDVRYDVRRGDRTVDVAVATCRGSEVGLKAWWIEADGTFAAAGPALPVLDGEPPYGLGLYRQPSDGALSVFVTSKRGVLEQWRLWAGSDGRLAGERMRQLRFGDQELEGCVVDDEHGRVFVAEEKVALWVLPAAGAEGVTEAAAAGCVAIARAGSSPGCFPPDVEGLALWCGADGGGYLVASMQGESRYWFFDRRPPHALVAILQPTDGPDGLGAPRKTDGLCIGHGALGPRLPSGVLVCQDGVAASGRQCFKWFDLRALAPVLEVVPGWSPRAR